MKPHSTMGTWKTRIIKKMGKRSWTKSNRAKMHALMPPEGGWTGGDADRVNSLGRKVPV